MTLLDVNITAMGAAAAKGSRIQIISRSIPVATLSATRHELVGDGTRGLTMVTPGRLMGMDVLALVGTLDADTTYTVTAYKGSIDAANAIFSVAGDINQTAGESISLADVAVNTTGKNIFAAGDDLLVEGVATSDVAVGGAVRDGQVYLYFMTDI